MTIDDLNARMQLRFEHHHYVGGHSGPGGGPQLGREEDGWLLELLNGIDSEWAEQILKYDIKHFLKNWCGMVAASKTSELFRRFMCDTSAALFKMVAGEAERVKLHLRGRGTPKDNLKKLCRRFWRRHAKYCCPEPKVIVRGLLDVFLFYRELDDPETGGKFFVGDADKIFKKEIAYAQEGYLSDQPHVDYYPKVKGCGF